MGKLSGSLIAVQDELEHLAVREPPRPDLEHNQGPEQREIGDPSAGRLRGAGGGPGRASLSPCGRHSDRLEAGTPAGRHPPGTDTGGAQEPEETSGNVGERNPPENHAGAAEQSQAETQTRRRSQFLHRQQLRAEQVKLRHRQQKTALGQQEHCSFLRRISEDRELAGDLIREEDPVHGKLSLTPLSRSQTPERGQSAGVADGHTQRLEQSEFLGAPCLTPKRRNPLDSHWEGHAASTPPPADATGLKLFREPSAKSNRLILHNALTYCCLAGKANQSQRSQVIEELMKCQQNQCLILFRDHKCQFRALYTYSPETEETRRLWGTGPKAVSKEMIGGLYKYNSHHKQFHAIPSKTMSASVDALTIHGHLWQGRKKAHPKVPARTVLQDSPRSNP